jgi:hypothetical protein
MLASIDIPSSLEVLLIVDGFKLRRPARFQKSPASGIAPDQRMGERLTNVIARPDLLPQLTTKRDSFWKIVE